MFVISDCCHPNLFKLPYIRQVTDQIMDLKIFRVIMIFCYMQLIYGGMGEASEEFVEKLAEGPAVAKLMLFRKPDESETELETETPAEEEEEGSESDEEEAGEAKAEETDALVEIVKLIYGHTATVGQEGEMQPDPER